MLPLSFPCTVHLRRHTPTLQHEYRPHPVTTMHDEECWYFAPEICHTVFNCGKYLHDCSLACEAAKLKTFPLSSSCYHSVTSVFSNGRQSRRTKSSCSMRLLSTVSLCKLFLVPSAEGSCGAFAVLGAEAICNGMLRCGRNNNFELFFGGFIGMSKWRTKLYGCSVAWNGRI